MNPDKNLFCYVLREHFFRFDNGKSDWYHCFAYKPFLCFDIIRDAKIKCNGVRFAIENKHDVAQFLIFVFPLFIAFN